MNHASRFGTGYIPRTAGEPPIRIIECEEFDTVDIPINYLLGPGSRLLLNPEIESGNYFSASLRRGVLSLRANGYVGYIPLNDDVVVRVRPRVPIVNLTQIAEVSGLPQRVLSYARAYDLSGPWRNSLADLFAVALAGQVDNIIVNGLLREYQRQEQASSYPIGRVLLGPTAQLQARHGQRYRGVSTWFLRSMDNPANRCLKYAMWMIGAHYARSKQQSRESRLIQTRINAVYNTFDGVTLDHTLRFLHDPIVKGARSLPSYRAYYREALDVAAAIVHQRKVLLEEASRIGVRLPSLVLNMSDLFESYLRTALQLYAIENGWRWHVLDGNSEGSRPLYKGQTSVAATPDIVVRASQADRPLVVEVKYIPVSGRSPRDAVDQAVTYAACYETDRVVLVHPCGRDHTPGIGKLGDVGLVQVFQYRFDLAAADLSEEVDRFGRAIEALLGE